MQLLEPEQQYDNYDSIDQQARTNQSVATMRVETYNNSMSRRKVMGSNEGTSSPIINKLQQVYAIRNVPKPKRTTIQSFSSNLGPSKAELRKNISKAKLKKIQVISNKNSYLNQNELNRSESVHPEMNNLPQYRKHNKKFSYYQSIQNDRQSLGFRSQPKYNENRQVGQQHTEHNADLNNQSEDMINTSALIASNDQINS